MSILTRWPASLATRAGAAFATLLRSKRYKEKQAHNAELHAWENEGGNPAPPPKAPDLPVTTGSA